MIYACLLSLFAIECIFTWCGRESLLRNQGMMSLLSFNLRWLHAHKLKLGLLRQWSPCLISFNVLVLLAFGHRIKDFFSLVLRLNRKMILEKFLRDARLSNLRQSSFLKEVLPVFMVIHYLSVYSRQPKICAHSSSISGNWNSWNLLAGDLLPPLQYHLETMTNAKSLIVC